MIKEKIIIRVLLRRGELYFELYIEHALETVQSNEQHKNLFVVLHFILYSQPFHFFFYRVVNLRKSEQKIKRLEAKRADCVRFERGTKRRRGASEFNQVTDWPLEGTAIWSSHQHRQRQLSCYYQSPPQTRRHARYTNEHANGETPDTTTEERKSDGDAGRWESTLLFFRVFSFILLAFFRSKQMTVRPARRREQSNQ